MKSIFSYDNPVFAAISRIGDMFILSFIWLAASIPIITIGASTTALMSAAMKIIRERDTNVIKDYFRAFKANFRQATLIFLIMAAIGAVLGADIYWWTKHSGTDYTLVFGGISVGIAIPYLSTLLFVFAVQAVFDNKIKDTIRTAFLISIRHFGTSIAFIALFAGIYYVSTMFPIVGFFALIFGVGAAAMLMAVRMSVIFAKYNPEIASDVAAKNIKPEKQTVQRTDNSAKYKKHKVIK